MSQKKCGSLGEGDAKNGGLNNLTYTGADPGWSGGVEAKICRKGADFARFWPILERAAPPRPPSGCATNTYHLSTKIQ